MNLIQQPASLGYAFTCHDPHLTGKRRIRVMHSRQARRRQKPPPVQPKPVLFRRGLLSDKKFLYGLFVLWLAITGLSTFLMLFA